MLLNPVQKYVFYQSRANYYISEILLVKICFDRNNNIYKVLIEIDCASRLFTKIYRIDICEIVRQRYPHTIITDSKAYWVTADTLHDIVIDLDVSDEKQIGTDVMIELMDDIYGSEGHTLDIVPKAGIFINENITHESDNHAHFINN